MKGPTKAAKLAEVLADEKWHTSTELVEKVGHRFGAAILQLRKGDLDDCCWVIEGEPVEGERGVWRYRFTDFQATYEPECPRCPKCGTKMVIHDVRNGSAA